MVLMRHARYSIRNRYLGLLALAAFLAPFLSVLVLGPILHQVDGYGLNIVAGIVLIASLANLTAQLIVAGFLHTWLKPTNLWGVLGVFLAPFVTTLLCGTLLLEDGFFEGLLVSLAILGPYLALCLILMAVVLRRERVATPVE
jgi:hypothetical protein